MDTRFEWSLKLKEKGIHTFSVQRFSVPLLLSEEVFSPHPDTLLLASKLQVNVNDKVLDLGVGTGMLAITAALLGAGEVIGVDINKAAVQVSQKNALLNAVEKQCEFLVGNWFGPVGRKKFDMIICNHPQIPGNSSIEKRFFHIATCGGGWNRQNLKHFIGSTTPFTKERANYSAGKRMDGSQESLQRIEESLYYSYSWNHVFSSLDI